MEALPVVLLVQGLTEAMLERAGPAEHTPLGTPHGDGSRSLRGKEFFKNTDVIDGCNLEETSAVAGGRRYQGGRGRGRGSSRGRRGRYLAVQRSSSVSQPLKKSH